MRLSGKIEAGRLKLYRPYAVEQYTSQLEDGTEVYMIIQKQGQGRTLPQNAYYWKLMRLLGNEIGYEHNEMHDALKYEFLREHPDATGKTKVLPKIKSTAQLTTVEFTDYIERIKRFAAEKFQINLPDAEEMEE